MNLRSTANVYYTMVMIAMAAPPIYRADLAGEQRPTFRPNKKRQWKKRRRSNR